MRRSAPAGQPVQVRVERQEGCFLRTLNAGCITIFVLFALAFIFALLMR